MKELIYGIHSIENLLFFTPKRFIKVFIFKNRNDLRIKNIINNLNKNNILIKFCNKVFLNKKCNGLIHQGIIAEIYKNKKYSEKNIYNILKNTIKPLLLILDCITDPRNLGACIRNAYASGVNIIIIPKKNSAKINSLVKKVSCGVCDNIPIISVVNLSRTLFFLKKINIVIIGATHKSNNLFYNINYNIPLALIFGSENKGIRKLTSKLCDLLISIPMKGNILSLNVSVATGIVLFEVIRQRFYLNFK
ncbi:23S rRNA (guanosine(2251)-2'-O)-methyltransferase RlmB [Enterobacteriaceae bacterium ET-AT1-13]|nr:23S rRNA (guanosine(2251)-2'-O)-methyltransferase RlmB [Enterobacteriaceae bacterium ET-AT1-13]WGS66484.1 23S rRNA (guanosine(2251)-2'-O)-methyltransferase RlmB [Enterobacteriaceae bacterium Cmel17]WMC17508.1 MAG: 23S rRNA (guanosine(2251)-2'-O)-methyltransferase RlmB [Enterobacteriaceae bacterium Cmel21]WMC17715.1 MAG: 23S rRNA (guanosine(2251)-2'-O)-methyltransferase RlmB [Enterobacteriaceae bacterium PSmelAO3-2]WMC17919.1 MAG: 23S rRNA (guanosine(2251)-2'-O)-methyltransferase RlmB [Entero